MLRRVPRCFSSWFASFVFTCLDSETQGCIIYVREEFRNPVIILSTVGMMFKDTELWLFNWRHKSLRDLETRATHTKSRSWLLWKSLFPKLQQRLLKIKARSYTGVGGKWVIDSAPDHTLHKWPVCRFGGEGRQSLCVHSHLYPTEQNQSIWIWLERVGSEKGSVFA